MLKLEQINKAFGERQVLRDVSLAVAPGQLLLLSGPSGAGKSTLLQIAAGLLQPDSGRREVNTRRIGYAFQDERLLPWRSVRRNLLFALHATVARKESERLASEWLTFMGLEASAAQKPMALSGGMRRRLAIARALAVEPELLLLDEPFAFQNEEWISALCAKLAEIAAGRGTAILLASHQVPLSLRAESCSVLPLNPNG